MKKPDLTIKFYSFRLIHQACGRWRARVDDSMGNRGLVVYPGGRPVEESNRQAIIDYLIYAYGGQTKCEPK